MMDSWSGTLIYFLGEKDILKDSNLIVKVGLKIIWEKITYLSFRQMAKVA